MTHIHQLLRSKLLIALFVFTTLLILIPKNSQAQPVSKVDIFFLFDETGSFSTFAPQVTGVFSELSNDLETSLPGIEFGFGVGSFKDFGGEGWDFCSNHSENCVEDYVRRVNGRPFYLHQPIITVATAGSAEQRNNLIIAALNRNGPGTGGDDPESHIEALWQIATGAGFDGNGDGAFAGLDGSQPAAAESTQLNPDTSGDVPPFSPLASGTLSSGNLGGAGFRPDALKIVIIATEICAALPFPAGSNIPAAIEGRYSTELISDFACRSVTPGDDRFGFVANAKSSAANTVVNAVVPAGAANFLTTIQTLNAADIRVIGMGPGLTARSPGSGPGHEPSGFLSALARITGGVDAQGIPLVFDIGSGGAVLKQTLFSALTNVAVVNPGCGLANFNPVIDGLISVLTREKRMALKYSKKTQNKKKFKKTRNRINKLTADGLAQLETFPRLTKVCQNKACPALDHGPALTSLSTSFAGLNKILRTGVKKSVKKARRKSTRQLRRKRRKKQSKIEVQAAGILQEQQANFQQLPAYTNNCS